MDALQPETWYILYERGSNVEFVGADEPWTYASRERAIEEAQFWTENYCKHEREPDAVWVQRGVIDEDGLIELVDDEDGLIELPNARRLRTEETCRG